MSIGYECKCGKLSLSAKEPTCGAPACQPVYTVSDTAHRQGREIQCDGDAVALIYGETQSEARDMAARITRLLNNERVAIDFIECTDCKCWPNGPQTLCWRCEVLKAVKVSA